MFRAGLLVEFDSFGVIFIVMLFGYICRGSQKSLGSLALFLGQQARLFSAEGDPAVFVNKNTKVICQGLTGKNGTFHTEQVGGNKYSVSSPPRCAGSLLCLQEQV
jgi:hypothetical protein